MEFVRGVVEVRADIEKDLVGEVRKLSHDDVGCVWLWKVMQDGAVGVALGVEEDKVIKAVIRIVMGTSTQALSVNHGITYNEG